MQRFDKDALVAECLAAVRSEGNAPGAVNEIVQRAVSEPATIEREVRPWSESPMMTVWHRSDELTALHIVWPPEVDLFAHDHNMWAVIGIYGGREDNIFWRKIKDHPDGLIEAAGARALTTGDTCPMGPDIIHSVTNPIPRLTAALHVYGGDFFEAERSEWDSENLHEHPIDIEQVKARFSPD